MLRIIYIIFLFSCLEISGSGMSLLLFIKILLFFLIYIELDKISNFANNVKDGLPYLFHSFRNKYFNKISLGNMLYYQNKL